MERRSSTLLEADGSQGAEFERSIPLESFRNDRVGQYIMIPRCSGTRSSGYFCLHPYWILIKVYWREMRAKQPKWTLVVNFPFWICTKPKSLSPFTSSPPILLLSPADRHQSTLTMILSSPYLATLITPLSVLSYLSYTRPQLRVGHIS